MNDPRPIDQNRANNWRDAAGTGRNLEEDIGVATKERKVTPRDVGTTGLACHSLVASVGVRDASPCCLACFERREAGTRSVSTTLDYPYPAVTNKLPGRGHWRRFAVFEFGPLWVA